MPIGHRDLNADEFKELGLLRDRIGDRIRENRHLVPEEDYPAVEIAYAYDDFDLDALRVYDKLLHLMSFRAQPIHLTVKYLHDNGIHEASPWLTPDHVIAYNRLYRAFVEVELAIAKTADGTFDPVNRNKVCSLVFPDCSDVDLIESIVRTRRILDVHGIEALIKEFKSTMYHPATQEGAL